MRGSKPRRGRRILAVVAGALVALGVVVLWPRAPGHYGDGKAELVMEMTTVPVSDEVIVWNTWTVSPVRRRLAYVVRRGGMESVVRWHDSWPANEAGEYELVVIDGVEQKPYDEILKSWAYDHFGETFYDDVVVFSEDGKHFAYAARLGEKWFVVRDGKEGKAYDAIGEWPIKFSPDGRRLAYAAESAGKKFVVDNGNEGTTYDQIDARVFSPDGTKMGYLAWRQPPSVPFSVINGVEGKLPANDSTWDMFLRNDGTWVPSDAPKWVSHGPVVSSDGRHVAYAAHKRSVFRLINRRANDLLGRRVLKVRGPNERVYVDSKPVGAPCRSVGVLFFSSDSKHIAAVVETADGYYAMVDGRLRQPLYDFSLPQWWPGPTTAPGRYCHVEALATKDSDVVGFRITELALVPSEARAEAD